MNNLRLLILAIVVLASSCGDDGESASAGTEPTGQSPVSADDQQGEDQTGPNEQADDSQNGDQGQDQPTEPDQDPPTGAEPIDRMAAAIEALGTGLTQAESTCIAERLSGDLTETSFDVVTASLEADTDLQPGDLSDDEIRTVADGFAQCGDLSFVLDEFELAEIGGEALSDCLVSQIGIDGLEALLMTELLYDAYPAPPSPLMVTSFDVCESESRTLVASDLGLTPGQATCLDNIATTELLGALDDGGFSSLQDLIEQSCPA